MHLIKRDIVVTILRIESSFTSMEVTFDETKSFYMQWERSFEVDSFESLESSFPPLI